ncbi:MAG: DUF3592 domain-containing protein [Anaerolinea sp.]|nr:DUF3592 domain-containing protein [Anaerolinea sp.]
MKRISHAANSVKYHPFFFLDPEYACLAQDKPENLPPYSFRSDLKSSIRVIFLRIFMAILMPSLVVSLIHIYQENKILYQLQAEGISVQGVVLRTYEKTVRRGNSSNTVTFIVYQFQTPNGMTYITEIEAHANEARILQENTIVTVRYLPKDPTISRFASRVPTDLRSVLDIILIGVAIAGGFSLFALWASISASLNSKSKKVHELLQQGAILIHGYVNSCELTGKGWGWRSYRLSYGFASLPGHESILERDLQLDASHVGYDHPPAPQTPLLILYLNVKSFELL